jgi:NIMA (never in mitosis gene a)-related kinase
VNKGRLAYTQTGTPYYASPEVWRDEPYDSKSDIWSFGCIIYEMAALKPPFAGRDMESLYRNIQRCTYDHIPNCYSRDLETVIGLCMQKNPKLRPSSSELLNNPIVQKYAERLQMGKELDQPD